MRYLYYLPLLALLSACGPSTRMQLTQNFIPSYSPSNSYQEEHFPKDVQRVLLMPLYSKEQEWISLEGLHQSFEIELIQTHLFEVIPVGRKQLIELFGQPQFSASGSFPPNFIDTLNQHYRADAILLIDLSQFRPYQPIAMGIRAKLIAMKDYKILWAFDDIFDAGDTRVATGAKRYQQRYQTQNYPLHKPVNVLQSPRCFARYVAFTVFQSLLPLAPKPPPKP
jgi:hypothetical protein